MTDVKAFTNESGATLFLPVVPAGMTWEVKYHDEDAFAFLEECIELHLLDAAGKTAGFATVIPAEKYSPAVASDFERAAHEVVNEMTDPAPEFTWEGKYTA